MIVLLKDKESKNIDAVITTEKTTSEDIKHIVWEERQKGEFDLLERIRRNLPADCIMIDSWSKEFNTIFY